MLCYRKWMERSPWRSPRPLEDHVPFPAHTVLPRVDRHAGPVDVVHLAVEVTRELPSLGTGDLDHGIGGRDLLHPSLEPGHVVPETHDHRPARLHHPDRLGEGIFH